MHNAENFLSFLDSSLSLLGKEESSGEIAGNVQIKKTNAANNLEKGKLVQKEIMNVGNVSCSSQTFWYIKI